MGLRYLVEQGYMPRHQEVDDIMPAETARKNPHTKKDRV